MTASLCPIPCLKDKQCIKLLLKMESIRNVLAEIEAMLGMAEECRRAQSIMYVLAYENY